MRIVGGKFRGRRLQAPKQIPARPTTDFAKESLFNMLNNRLDWHQTSMLDLFSGIGSISIEAISRGAKQVTSVDANFAAVKWYYNLTNELKITNWKVVKQDVFKWLNQNEHKFDFIFADPPYDAEYYPILIEKILIEKLNIDGIFVLEHRKSDSFENHSMFDFDRVYGEVKFSFFKLKETIND